MQFRASPRGVLVQEVLPQAGSFPLFPFPQAFPSPLAITILDSFFPIPTNSRNGHKDFLGQNAYLLKSKEFDRIDITNINYCYLPVFQQKDIQSVFLLCGAILTRL